ncbi:MAG TPA: T9SS type A sorting domain-containing protein [Chitinophagaceae bacterium]|nr:T9SS type A sorting domain-containing protein [Chitinophagaceae bacterium]
MKTSFYTMFAWFLAVTGISTIANAQGPGPKLNSYPSAQATIYLDFDGQTVVSPYWNSGQPIVCASANFTDDQITTAFNKVSEDYRPFNINVTTDSAVYFAAPGTRRIRIIITPTYQWYGMAGGVSYVGSFRWGNNVPAFVFSNLLGNNPSYVADASSHEAGHSLGLNHQSKYNVDCSISAEYNPGTGSGQTSWAPLMGNSYSKTLSTWFNGPSSSIGCNSSQDDMSVISNVSTNGTGYKTDDIGNTRQSSSSLSFTQSTQAFNSTGTINTTSDVDYFNFTLPVNGQFKLNAIPFNTGSNNLGSNLHIAIGLYQSNGVLINNYISSSTLDVNIDTSLTAGQYYLSIDGVASNYTPSDYGIVGGYTLNGSYLVTGGLPIYSFDLTGFTRNDQHELNWKIVADEEIESITVQQSKDGKNFSSVYSLNGEARSYTYKPFDNKNTYYKIKAVTAMGITYYSNTILLKGILGGSEFSILNNTISSELVVLSKETSQYQIVSVNGNVVATGTLNNGTTHINLSNIASGLYFIRVQTFDEIISKKFIKQ